MKADAYIGATLIPTHFAAQALGALLPVLGFKTALARGAGRLGCLARLGADQRRSNEGPPAVAGCAGVLLLCAVIPGGDEDCAVVRQPSSRERAQAHFHRLGERRCA